MFSTTYEFSNLPIGCWQSEGSAEIEYEPDGQWEIYSVTLIGAVDDYGGVSPFHMLHILEPGATRALLTGRAKAIQEAVNEALSELDPVADRGDFQ